MRVTGRSEESLSLRTVKSTYGPDLRRAAPALPAVTADPIGPAEPPIVPTADADSGPGLTVPGTRRGPRDSPAGPARVCGGPLRPAVAAPRPSSTYRNPRTAERTQPRAPLRAMKGRPSDAP